MIKHLNVILHAYYIYIHIRPSSVSSVRVLCTYMQVRARARVCLGYVNIYTEQQGIITLKETLSGYISIRGRCTVVRLAAKVYIIQFNNGESNKTHTQGF